MSSYWSLPTVFLQGGTAIPSSVTLAVLAIGVLCVIIGVSILLAVKLWLNAAEMTPWKATGASLLMVIALSGLALFSFESIVQFSMIAFLFAVTLLTIVPILIIWRLSTIPIESAQTYGGVR